jgi:hypothetical protein
MNTIDVSHESDIMADKAPVEHVRQVLARILAEIGKDGCELSCSFVSDGTMRDLNHAYRGRMRARTSFRSCKTMRGSSRSSRRTGSRRFSGTSSFPLMPWIAIARCSPSQPRRN